MCSCDTLQGHSKEDGDGFVCDLWCLCPAVTRASQMLSAFRCSNMWLSKGLKQVEQHWNYYTQRWVNMPRKDTASKTGTGILFLALQLPGGFGRLLRISRPLGPHLYSGDVGDEVFPSSVWHSNGQGMRESIFDYEFNNPATISYLCVEVEMHRH